MARIRQKPVLGVPRRLLNWFRSQAFKGVGKTQDAYFVTINGHRYKRVVFGDSHQAAAVADALESYRRCVGLPELILSQENEVWVRFVEGRKPDPEQAEDWLALNDFFAALYAADHYQIDLDSTPLHERLLVDLAFLRDCGIFDGEQHARLADCAERLKPEQIWLGADYVDPVLKNFVVNDRGLFVIDIESLHCGVMLGTGVAKSSLHWLGRDSQAFFERLLDHKGVPDLRPQKDYVELSFLSGWTKRKLLTGKWSRVQTKRFERFL
jgi:hypothetical protein